MDVALCGGGDPNQGFYDESVQLSSSAVSMVQAAIFMGDPMWVDGLPYSIGTCKAGGVCMPTLCCIPSDPDSSLTRGRRDLPAHPARKSSPTAMPPTRTAAMAVTRKGTRPTEGYTARTPFPLCRTTCSRATLVVAAVTAVTAAATAITATAVALAALCLVGDSAEGRVTRDRLPARVRIPASRSTSGTRSVCRWSMWWKREAQWK